MKVPRRNRCSCEVEHRSLRGFAESIFCITSRRTICSDCEDFISVRFPDWECQKAMWDQPGAHIQAQFWLAWGCLLLRPSTLSCYLQTSSRNGIFRVQIANRPNKR
jgi:hypothetical protein